MRKGNPLISRGIKSQINVQDSTNMTYSGTIAKAFLLIAIVGISFLVSFTFASPYNYTIIAVPMVIVGAGISLITAFNPRIAKYTGIIYAIVEGIFLGAITELFNAFYPGIAMQAILLTIIVSLVSLLVYRSAPAIADKVRKAVFIGLISLLIVYAISIILILFGVSNIPIYGSGVIGIAFSILVIVLAVMTLMVDFDNIVKGVKYGAPQYMEWYCAFGLSVTLIWLYMEILNLLIKIRSRD